MYMYIHIDIYSGGGHEAHGLESAGKRVLYIYIHIDRYIDRDRDRYR